MITIHGKQYVTVAERLTAISADMPKFSIITELVPSDGPVVFKATVITERGTFIGHSAANPNKLIEKENPYEVAETSAVGRALGFAGYGAVESVASGDDMVVATRQVAETQTKTPMQALGEAFTPGSGGDLAPVSLGVCRDCGAEMVLNPKTGKVFCKDKCWLKK